MAEQVIRNPGLHPSVQYYSEFIRLPQIILEICEIHDGTNMPEIWLK